MFSNSIFNKGHIMDLRKKQAALVLEVYNGEGINDEIYLDVRGDTEGLSGKLCQAISDKFVDDGLFRYGLRLLLEGLDNNTCNYAVAHKHSFRRRKELLGSSDCGCFNCLKIYPPFKIKHWTDFNENEVGETAICPYCGIDSVLGDKSGCDISDSFLRLMNQIYFGGHIG
jgi:hypothetical protein